MAAVEAVTFQFWVNGPLKRFTLLSGREAPTEVEPGRVSFAGSVAVSELRHFYHEATIMLNHTQVSSGIFLSLCRAGIN